MGAFRSRFLLPLLVYRDDLVGGEGDLKCVDRIGAPVSGDGDFIVLAVVVDELDVEEVVQHSGDLLSLRGVVPLP